jgi:hypothetical protein
VAWTETVQATRAENLRSNPHGRDAHQDGHSTSRPVRTHTRPVRIPPHRAKTRNTAPKTNPSNQRRPRAASKTPYPIPGDRFESRPIARKRGTPRRKQILRTKTAARRIRSPVSNPQPGPVQIPPHRAKARNAAPKTNPSNHARPRRIKSPVSNLRPDRFESPRARNAPSALAFRPCRRRGTIHAGKAKSWAR